MSQLEQFARRHGADVKDLRRWLVEAMVLGAVADGELDSRESESIVDAIATRPEFRGMDAPELRRDLEAAWTGIMNDGFDVRLHALAGALPRYAHRVLAFRGAALIALSNGELAPEEFDFLRRMQKVLGISETDVAKAFDEAGDSGAALPDRIAPVEAYLDCLLMSAASDRHFGDEEMATVIAFVLTRSEFEGIPEERIHDTIQRRLHAFAAAGGTDRRLETIGQELQNEEERENAYGLALSVAMADGDLDPPEITFLAKLQRALHISESRAVAVRRSVESEDE